MGMEDNKEIIDPTPKEVDQALREIEIATNSKPSPVAFWQEGSMEAAKKSEELKDDTKIINESSFSISNRALSRILIDLKWEMQKDYYYKKYAPVLYDLRNVFMVTIKDNNGGLSFEVYTERWHLFGKRKELIIFKITPDGKIALP